MATFDVNVNVGSGTEDAGKVPTSDGAGGIDWKKAVATDGNPEGISPISSAEGVAPIEFRRFIDSSTIDAQANTGSVSFNLKFSGPGKYHYSDALGEPAEGDMTAAGRALLDDADAAAQRTTLGLGALATKSTVATGDIDADVVTNAKLANMAQATIKGRQAGSGTGDPEDLTAAQARTILGIGVVERTGATIAFDSPAIYNSPTSPSSSTVTLDLSGAVVGTEVVAYFNHSAEPTWPAGVTAVGGWNNSALNVVRFLYQGASDISATIISDAATVTNGEVTVNKAQSESRASTTTLAADTDIKFPMAANKKYRFRAVIFGGYASATPGLKYGFTGPASPTLVRIARKHLSSGTAPANSLATAYDTSGLAFTGSMSTIYIELDGYIENGANAGEFQFTWAQNSSNGTASTITRGGNIKFEEVP